MSNVGTLVPVKRMVSRKGKSFVQTFYVRSDQLPKKPSAPKRADVPISVSRSNSGPFGDAHVYTLIRDGAHMTAKRIPQSAIHSTFTWNGRDFAVHSRYDPVNQLFVSNLYDVSDISSGTVVYTKSDIESLEEVKDSAINSMKHNRSLNRRLRMSTSLTERPESDLDDSPSRMDALITQDHIAEAALEIADAMGWSINNESALATISSWIEQHIDYREELDLLLNEIEPSLQFALETAILGDQEWGQAKETARVLQRIAARAHYDIDRVSEWHQSVDMPPLTTDDFLEVDDTNLELSVDQVDDILHRAYERMVDEELSLSEAQDWIDNRVEELMQEEEDADQTLSEFSFTDSLGIPWDGRSLSVLGTWVVGGVVKDVRDQVKLYDRERRFGNEDVKGDVQEVVESHIEQLPKDDVLYRGTGNPAWLMAEKGDVINVGLASFFHTQSAVEPFMPSVDYEGTRKKILIELKSTEENRIRGTDVARLIQELQERDDDILKSSKISIHRNEEEFLVRTPSVKVVDIVDTDETTRIVVEPNEMDLIKSMANVFVDRIAEMEKTFDQAMRDDENAFPDEG